MDEGKSKRSGQLHAGHRSRVRRRFLATGLNSFQDHEVLELLLFYAVPRRDVNEMAHMLINRFGSLQGVLDAPEEALQDIPGVGPKIAHFLSIIPSLMAQLSRHADAEPMVLKGPKSLEYIMAQRQLECPLGHLVLILTDYTRAVVAIHTYDSFSDICLRELISKALLSRARGAVLVERVADCTDFPPEGRLQALRELSAQMQQLEIPLRDFYTIDFLGHPPHSFARSGQLLPW